MLSKIVTQQQDSVIFNYSTGGATTSTYPDYNQSFGNYCASITGFTSNPGSIPVYYNQTLQSIDFTSGHLQFAFDSSRSDLLNSYKLDSLLIFSKNAAGIQTFVKQENFYYSYFNSTYNTTNYAEVYRLKLDSVKEKSGNYLSTPYSFVYNNPNPGPGSEKHSFNVDHWGYYNGSSNSILIPSMTFICTFYPNPIGDYPVVMNYAGGNRQPNFPNMQTFSIQQVTYPTGGKTVLAYQPNDYDYSNSTTGNTDPFVYVQTVPMDPTMVITHHGTTTGTIDLTGVYPVIPSGTVANNVTVNIGFRYLINGSYVYSNTSGKIYFSMAGFNMDIHASSCIPNSNICTLSTPANISPAKYTWTAYIDPTVDTVGTFAGMYIDVSYNLTQQSYLATQNNSYVMPAAGLRVQSITNYKDANTIASEKVYSYTYTQDLLGTGQPQYYTYGRLMALPSYARYVVTPVADQDSSYCAGLYLYSGNLTSLTSASQGNIVGYDRVTETSVDPQTGLDIGQTIYQYFNSPDTATWYAGYRMPGTFNMPNNLNGLLISKVNYSDNYGLYSKVDETDYFYHTANRLVYWSPKYQYFLGQHMNQVHCASGVCVATETIAWFYPSIKSERILLDSTKKIFFQQGDATKTIVSTESDYYDNPVHYQVTRNKSVDSKGNAIFTVLKYPQDYSSNGLPNSGNSMIDSMIGRNMISETIEKRDSLIYYGSPTGYITGAQLSLYRQLGTSLPIVPDKIYKLDIQLPVTNFLPFYFTGNTLNIDSRNRLMASFDQYDASNNMQQYTTTDQNPVSIIWDYSHVYPVAQAKNAVITDVAATSFEADGYGNWSPYTGAITTVTTAPFPPTGNNYYNLTTSATLSKSGLVSGNVYIISYWSKNGSYSITGGTGTSVTGKTINGWTYYEHKITASSTTLTISGTGAIDEVRLYPSNALMTTYTYTPLIGMTTSCDPDSKVTYYYFDGLGRLKWAKDQDGNILKTYQYHYSGGVTQY